jgi:hypothetical protein
MDMSSHRTKMVSQHAERYRPARRMMREIGYVALNLGIQVDAPGFNEFEQRHTCKGLRDARDDERHLRISRSAFLQAGEAIGFTKYRAAVLPDADRDGGVLLPRLSFDGSISGKVVTRQRGICLTDLVSL